MLPTGRLLREALEEVDPAFELTDFKPGYWFRRGPRDRIYDFVILGSSRTSYSADVGCGYSPEKHTAYGYRLLHAMRPLACVALPAEAHVYEHDGTEAGARDTLRSLSAQLREKALPWWEEFHRAAREHGLVYFALDWIEANPGGGLADLKLALQARARERKLSRELWKEIPFLARDLLGTVPSPRAI